MRSRFEALFKQTTSTLHALDSSLDHNGFAGEFRSCMTEGQRMKGHNQFREDFYKRVVEKAKQLEAHRGCNIRVRSYACLRCSARHRTRLRVSKHLLNREYSIIHLSPGLPPPILRFKNSLNFFGHRVMSLRHPVLLELGASWDVLK